MRFWAYCFEHMTGRGFKRRAWQRVGACGVGRLGALKFRALFVTRPRCGAAGGFGALAGQIVYSLYLFSSADGRIRSQHVCMVSGNRRLLSAATGYGVVYLC